MTLKTTGGLTCKLSSKRFDLFFDCFESLYFYALIRYFYTMESKRRLVHIALCSAAFWTCSVRDVWQQDHHEGEKGRPVVSATIDLEI